jgi:hypothetical protein
MVAARTSGFVRGQFEGAKTSSAWRAAKETTSS